MQDFEPITTLIYDSKFDIKTLRENKPYRNIGQLLMSQSSIRDALILCGADERIINGEASDYECFSAICTSMDYLPGHKVYIGIKLLLERVFGIEGQLSPCNCEELWSVLNSFIDDNELTPSDLLSFLGIESLSLRVSPFEAFCIDADGIDVYSVTDLCDIISLVTSPDNSESDLEGFIKSIAAAVKTRAELGSYGVFFTLGGGYEFTRMSRKHELYEIYNELKSGKNVPISAQNGLKTYVLTSLFGTFRALNCNIITDFPCSADEHTKLLNYLRLNKNLPSSMLIYANDPNEVLPIALEFSTRNDYGLPSIIPICKNIAELSKVFPIGLAIECQDGITDSVTIASQIASRSGIYDMLAQVDCIDPDSALFDITYANIKNRMRI